MPILQNITERQPLIVRAAIALILLGAVRLAVAQGWLPPMLGDVAMADVERYIDLIVLTWSWWSTHRAVTPTAAPRDDRGQVLVPLQRGPRIQP